MLFRSLIYKKISFAVSNASLRSVLLLLWGMILTSLLVTLMFTNSLPWYVPFRIGVFLSMLTMFLLTDPLNYYNPVVSFWVYYLVVCVLGADPILLNLVGPRFIVPETYQLLLLSFVCFWGGVSYVIFLTGSRRPPRLQQPVMSGGNKKISWIGLFVFVTGAILTLFIFRFVFGVVPLLAEDAENARLALRAGLGFLVFPAMVFLQVGSLIFFVCQVNRVGNMHFIIGTVVVLAASALIVGYGNRAPAAVVLLLAFILFSYIRYGSIQLGKALVVGLGLGLMIGAFGILRWGLSSDYYTLDKLFQSSLFRMMIVTPYLTDLIVQRFPHSVPFQHGATFWADLIALLPGPGESSGLLMKRLLGLQFNGGGIVPSFMGEFYVNFGWMGAGIGSFLTGMLLQWSGFAIAAKKGPRSPVDIVMITILVYQMAIMSSGLIGGIISMNILPLLIVWLVLKWIVKLSVTTQTTWTDAHRLVASTDSLNTRV